MSKLLTVGEAANILGVSTQTLRRWEREGKMIPSKRTIGNQRRYVLAEIQPFLPPLKNNKDLLTLAYARVSSHDQKDYMDLEVARTKNL